MPTATETAPAETRTMRLLSRALGPAGPLSAFIAHRRCPGQLYWQTWEEISFSLRELTGEHVTREGLHKMAVRYGIPDTTRTGSEKAYRKAIAKAGIKI